MVQNGAVDGLDVLRALSALLRNRARHRSHSLLSQLAPSIRQLHSRIRLQGDVCAIGDALKIVEIAMQMR